MPKRKIVFFGNCQAQALAWLCRRFLAPRQDDQILAITAPIKDIEAARKELLGADVIVEQVFDHALEIDVAVENQGQPIICFPNVYAIFYWPYTNQRHPRNDEIDTAYDAGPYPNEMGDSFLNKLIAKGVSADDALEQYLQDDMTARADRLFELNAASQMRRDELTGCAVQQQVQEYFRDEHLFLTSAHPNMRIFSTIAEHALGQLGYPKNRIADALAAQRVSPFPHHALPIHPRVAGHFGLRFATENMRYPFFEEGDFTFAEYVRRYMNFEWSEKLRDALAVAVKNPDEALDQLEQVLPSLPRSATAVRVKSSLLLRKQDHGGALWAATQAVERDPSDPQNWIALSVAHRAAREFSPAEAALDRALDAAPMDAGVHHERAHLDAAQGLWPVAVTEAQRAVEIEPGTARFHMSLADFLTHVGRFDEAIEATQRAVALEPHVGGYRFALAHRLDRNGQGEEAAALVRDLIAKDGHDRDGYVQTGHLLARNGDLDGAEKAFRQAARLAPDDAQIELALADVL
ncbi:MAG TPA: WcbI family polysaccharide biosynthesis putative acetyltransferase, partial [Stellaceae bacterium]|nr:WcbI family polysaccharide biosynthesis putative acetyltransferase [Stellaceae bacterium]